VKAEFFLFSFFFFFVLPLLLSHFSFLFVFAFKQLVTLIQLKKRIEYFHGIEFNFSQRKPLSAL
jgi:cell division protein FtsB